MTAIAFGLAMDAFAVSIAAGLAIERLTNRHVFRVAFHFVRKRGQAPQTEPVPFSSAFPLFLSLPPGGAFRSQIAYSSLHFERVSPPCAKPVWTDNQFLPQLLPSAYTPPERACAPGV